MVRQCQLIVHNSRSAAGLPDTLTATVAINTNPQEDSYLVLRVLESSFGTVKGFTPGVWVIMSPKHPQGLQGCCNPPLLYSGQP